MPPPQRIGAAHGLGAECEGARDAEEGCHRRARGGMGRSGGNVQECQLDSLKIIGQ